MGTNQRAMERMQIVVTRKQAARMRRLAAEFNVSVSEIYRRAADAYSIGEEDDEIHNPELEALVEAVEAGARRAGAAIERAEREVAATLDFYDARRRAREARTRAE